MATTIENNGFTGDVAGLVQQIQTYATNSNAFDQAQGGLWSARFWNEFRTDGTSGTAATALIEGLQTHNAGEVNAAVEQLAANSADVGSNNNMADGGSYASVVAAAQATAVTPAGGNAAADPAAAPPAAAVPAAAATPPAAAAAAGLTATDLFNDATTREIGGVGPDQVNLIVSDLIGVQQMLSAADPQINNLTDLHTHIIINQLNEEIASVENANAPTTGTLTIGTDLGQYVGRSINDIHRDIIDIAQGDAGVQALFNPTPLPALNTPAAPFHDNADQTTFITQWIQDSNHLGQAATTIENNGFTGDVAGLVQQIQTYANNSNAFDQAQGGLWSARFWNEFRSDGTSGTAANALIEGLQTHNAGEVNAAVEQLAANSADVGSNNVMADGGSYASVVAAAQATAVTPAGGNAAADPAAAPPVGGAGDGLVAAVLNPGDLYFENMFNDATRILEGGLWHNNVPVGNQGNGTDGRYTADLKLVQTGLTADVAANDFAGVQLTDVNKVLGDLNTALASVQGAVNNDPAAEAALRAAHLDIINTIENDSVLQALSIKDGNPGFNFAPPELATPLNANTAHTTFAELGAIFDDAQSKSLGGINANNLPGIQADLQAVHDGLLTLMTERPAVVWRRDRHTRFHHR